MRHHEAIENLYTKQQLRRYNIFLGIKLWNYLVAIRLNIQQDHCHDTNGARPHNIQKIISDYLNDISGEKDWKLYKYFFVATIE